jgi:DNA-binding NtrC family response regulator
MADILIVDDEPGIRSLLSEILADEGHRARQAENAAEAKREVAKKTPDLVLLDIWMPEQDGISLLREWAAEGPLPMPVVMMSGHGTIDTAVEATKIGAASFLEKPISMQKLLETVKSALAHSAYRKVLPKSLANFGHLTFFKDMKQRLEQAAKFSPAMCLPGGTALLAELCACTLHSAKLPFCVLADCDEPMRQEQLQKLAGGVVFAGDLAQLGKLAQMNLAFLLPASAPLRIRIIAASSVPLARLRERGWPPEVTKALGKNLLSVPDLSRYRRDWPNLAKLLLELLAEKGEAPPRHFAEGAAQAFAGRNVLAGQSVSWDTFQNIVRSVALASLTEEISEEDLRAALPESRDETALADLFNLTIKEAREQFERCYFDHLLAQENGNMTRVSERSGIERTHLYRKLKQLNIERTDTP